MTLAWRIEIDKAAKKDLAKLDKTTARRITAFLRGRVASLDNPRSIGEALKGTTLKKAHLHWLKGAFAPENGQTRTEIID